MILKISYLVILSFIISYFQLHHISAWAQDSVLLGAIQREEIADVIKPAPPVDVLDQLYERYGYKTLWFTGNSLNNAGKAFLHRLNKADEEGLFRYKMATDILAERLHHSLDEKNRTLCDLLLTSALTCYVRDITGYIFNPMAPRNEKDIQHEQLVPVVIDILDALNRGENIEFFIEKLSPAHHYYINLKAGLQRYLRIKRDGGWPTIQAGRKITPGDSDARIVAIRQRLATELDNYQHLATDKELYDSDCEAGIRSLQKKYGLEPDAIIGRETQSVLQQTTDDIIRKIAVNLTRWRWQSRELGKNFILVNIAGFYVQAMEGENSVLELPVVVGANNHQTPVFSSLIRRVELNPYWKIPQSIAGNELLPTLQRNPAYLTEKNIRLFASREPGAPELDSYSMNWGKISKNKMRSFLLRQNPGKDNALGAVKIVFPNQYDVYLHDTPQKHLFGKNRKNFSHGCIRVQDPVTLATYLLKSQPKWTEARIFESIATMENQVIPLTAPLPIHLTYQTAWATIKGDVFFREDIYERDPLIAQAMEITTHERGY